MTAWLGVVSAEHVRRGVSLGIAQIGHGKRSGLARLHPGDGFVYYSPTERLGDRTPLREFTAIGRIAEGEIWQADEGEFHPFRRRVDYLPSTTPVAVAELKGLLELTKDANWGYALRRGLIPLSDRDFETLVAAMTGSR
jgi:hypothetical protein